MNRIGFFAQLEIPPIFVIFIFGGLIIFGFLLVYFRKQTEEELKNVLN